MDNVKIACKPIARRVYENDAPNDDNNYAGVTPRRGNDKVHYGKMLPLRSA